jgi:hypothetical protein
MARGGDDDVPVARFKIIPVVDFFGRLNKPHTSDLALIEALDAAADVIADDEFGRSYKRACVEPPVPCQHFLAPSADRQREGLVSREGGDDGLLLRRVVCWGGG